jgi:glucosamine--fructose-6-phosphate aminotransferase (isomerizing)
MVEGSPATVAEEIAEQPRVLERLLARSGWDELAARVAERASEGVLTVARGSSDHAAGFLAYLVWIHLELPVASLPPSVATLYGRRPRAARHLAVGISQSGESPDVVRALETAREGGAYGVAFTNEPGSALARAADETVDLACGSERAVAATKTFTASLAGSLALVLRWAGRRDLVTALEQLPEAAARALELDVSPFVPPLAQGGGVYVLGRGPTLSVAREFALKLKEVARVHAEASSTHEFVHGPRAALEPGTPVVVVLPAGAPLRDGCRHVAELLRASGANVLDVGDTGKRVPGPDVIALDVGRDLPDELAPIPQAVALQRLAVAVAHARGIDPDRPRSIEKVTRTW